jgi:hypothetical protein
MLVAGSTAVSASACLKTVDAIQSERVIPLSPQANIACFENKAILKSTVTKKCTFVVEDAMELRLV